MSSTLLGVFFQQYTMPCTLSPPPRFPFFMQRWEGGVKNEVTVGGVQGRAADIEFVCGDFTVLDWSDGENQCRF